MSKEDFVEALGGRVGGRIDSNGHWECADCAASGYEVVEPGRPFGAALFEHRRQVHVVGQAG